MCYEYHILYHYFLIVIAGTHTVVGQAVTASGSPYGTLACFVYYVRPFFVPLLTVLSSLNIFFYSQGLAMLVRLSERNALSR